MSLQRQCILWGSLLFLIWVVISDDIELMRTVLIWLVFIVPGLLVALWRAEDRLRPPQAPLPKAQR
jgi:predicted membrane metal-binding protein